MSLRILGLVDEAGGEAWIATCRVERYIFGPMRHYPNVEETKSFFLIKVAFQQKAVPTPIKLMAGKKYLLFLKETSPNAYEMITPYHGAFEAGQDHFIHDEQSPEYPAAVKMPFEEIVRLVAQQSISHIAPASKTGNVLTTESQAVTAFKKHWQEVLPGLDEPQKSLAAALNHKVAGNLLAARLQPCAQSYKGVMSALPEKEKESLILHGRITDLQRDGDCWEILSSGGILNEIAATLWPDTGELILLWIIPEG